jgi:hypothetical protein
MIFILDAFQGGQTQHWVEVVIWSPIHKSALRLALMFRTRGADTLTATSETKTHRA